MTAPSNDQALAKAFRDMEGRISDLRNMATIMRMMADNTLFRSESWIEDEIKAKVPSLSGFSVSALTHDEDDALGYGIHKLLTMSSELYEKYYATLEGARAA